MIQKLEKKIADLPRVTKILETVVNPGEGLIRWACMLGWEESRRIFKESGKRGTRIHEYIASCMDGQPVPDLAEEDTPYAASFDVLQGFLEARRDIANYSSERSVSCLECGYRGTLDATFQINKAGRWTRNILVDFKTSTRLRVETAFQTAAYTHALVGHGVPPSEWPERWAIRLRDDGSMPELKPYYRHAEDWAGFQHALGLYRILKRKGA